MLSRLIKKVFKETTNIADVTPVTFNATGSFNPRYGKQKHYVSGQASAGTYTAGSAYYNYVAGYMTYNYVEGYMTYNYVEGYMTYNYVEGYKTYNYVEGYQYYNYVEGYKTYNYVEGYQYYNYVEGYQYYNYVQGVAGTQNASTGGNPWYETIGGVQAYNPPTPVAGTYAGTNPTNYVEGPQTGWNYYVSGYNGSNISGYNPGNYVYWYTTYDNYDTYGNWEQDFYYYQPGNANYNTSNPIISQAYANYGPGTRFPGNDYYNPPSITLGNLYMTSPYNIFIGYYPVVPGNWNPSYNPSYPYAGYVYPSYPYAGYVNPAYPYAGYVNPAYPYAGYVNPAYPYAGYVNPAYPYAGYVNPAYPYAGYVPPAYPYAGTNSPVANTGTSTNVFGVSLPGGYGGAAPVTSPTLTTAVPKYGTSATVTVPSGGYVTITFTL